MLWQKTTVDVFIPNAAAIESEVKINWVDLPVAQDSAGTSFLNNDGISTRRDPNDYLLRRFLSYKRRYAASFPLKIRCCSFLSASSRLISF